jgi:hypothetical protein
MDIQGSKTNVAPAKSISVTMNVDEARQIMWLRTNHRPLGELLDEGYLTQSKLQWAADKAYDSHLRCAARVLLAALSQSRNGAAHTPADTLHSVSVNQGIPDAALHIDISLEQARATLWPIPPYKGKPMGPLVDTHQLSLKDLGYAVEQAWDERVRRSAMALMLIRLKQAVKEPAPDAGFIRMVSAGRSYAEREQLRLTLLQGTLMGALLMGGLLLSMWLFIQQPPRPAMIGSMLQTAPIFTLGVLAIAVCLICGAVWVTNWLSNLVTSGLDKQIENHRQGQEGENRVADVMQQSLDGNWVLFRNIVLPGRNRGDLDAILVGPPGVWVFEVKTYSGEYRNVGERWEYRAGKRWKTLARSPSRQAEDNAIRLANFLKADHIKQWVTAVVVWANQEGSLSVENPATAVWPLERLSDELGNLCGQRVSDGQREAIVHKLTQLAQQQRDKDKRA